MANKWQAHRAGILNYWYYDEAEFEFAGGRLMLRGSERRNAESIRKWNEDKAA